MEKRLYINNIPTCYWISDDGRLRNEKTNKWRNPTKNGTQVAWSIYFRGKQKLIYAKQIIAKLFVENPNEYKYVHCKDGNFENICAWNLEWVENTGSFGCVRNGNIIQMPEGIEVKQFRNSRYGVSKEGHVYSIPNKIQLNEQFEGNKKYARVQLYHNINKKLFVHRIVWECYNGEIPEGYEIDHIDNNPLNNSLDNLQLITHKENINRRHISTQQIVIAYNYKECIIYHSKKAAIKSIHGSVLNINKALDNGTLYKNYYWKYKDESSTTIP